MSSRRAFLRGAGALIALPFLPSLLPRGARAEAAPPVRLLWMFAPNGVHQGNWACAGEGAGYTLGTTLAQLADVRDDLLVLDGLRDEAGFGDRAGDHARGTATFLTCTPIDFEGVHNGISADQVAAQGLGDATPFRSLELGVEGGGSLGFCDSGYSCAYTQNVSWSGPTSPNPKLTSPRLVFDRLFAGTGVGASPEAIARRVRDRRSVLDAVAAQATSLQAKVAVDDRAQLDAYLTGVRELERRVDELGGCGAEQGVPDEVTLEDHADVMLDLAVAAFRCDLTRVVTFMLGNAGSNLVYRFLPGVTGAHHELSHHQNVAFNLDQLAIIDAWTIGRYGRLVRKLRSIPEGDGTLLDHALVCFGSEIGDGNRHNHDQLPILLAGRGGGAVTPGRRLVAPDAPLASLHLAMIRAAGVDAAAFADASAPLPGLA